MGDYLTDEEKRELELRNLGDFVGKVITGVIILVLILLGVIPS